MTKAANTSGRVNIGFETDDMDTAIKMLTDAGAKIINGPIQHPNGVKILTVQDINGVNIGVAQH